MLSILGIAALLTKLSLRLNLSASRLTEEHKNDFPDNYRPSLVPEVLRQHLQHRSDHRGYGEHYLTIAGETLERMGLLALQKHDNGSHQPLWQWAADNGVKFSYQTIDVPREKDL